MIKPKDRDAILEELEAKAYPNTGLTKLVVSFKDVKNILNSITVSEEDEHGDLSVFCDEWRKIERQEMSRE